MAIPIKDYQTFETVRNAGKLYKPEVIGKLLEAKRRSNITCSERKQDILYDILLIYFGTKQIKVVTQQPPKR